MAGLGDFLQNVPSVVQGTTNKAQSFFGGNQLAGLANAVVGKVAGSPRPFGELFDAGLADAIAKQAAFAQAQPTADTFGKVGGAVGGTAVLGGLLNGAPLPAFKDAIVAGAGAAGQLAGAAGKLAVPALKAGGLLALGNQLFGGAATPAPAASNTTSAPNAFQGEPITTARVRVNAAPAAKPAASVRQSLRDSGLTQAQALQLLSVLPKPLTPKEQAQSTLFNLILQQQNQRALKAVDDPEEKQMTKQQVTSDVIKNLLPFLAPNTAFVAPDVAGEP